MDTGERSQLDCGLVFRSVGYRGAPMEQVPFHEKWGIFPNDAGQVTSDDGPVPGLYVTGWIKRGPSGVIGTNKADSVETVATLMEQLSDIPACEVPDTSAVLKILKDRNVRVVSFDEWQQIDAAEVAAGEAAGRPREKLVTVADMLDVLS